MCICTDTPQEIRDAITDAVDTLPPLGDPAASLTAAGATVSPGDVIQHCRSGPAELSDFHVVIDCRDAEYVCYHPASDRYTVLSLECLSVDLPEDRWVHHPDIIEPADCGGQTVDAFELGRRFVEQCKEASARSAEADMQVTDDQGTVRLGEEYANETVEVRYTTGTVEVSLPNWEKRFPDYATGDEARRIWTRQITDKVVIGEYDDGDVVIADEEDNHSWTDLLLSREQREHLCEFVEQDASARPDSQSLGSRPGFTGEVVVTDEAGEYHFSVENQEDITLSDQQATELVRLVKNRSPQSP